VDIRDLLRLIQSRGRDDPLCDIGPTVFGDGLVDAADLEVLMTELSQGGRSGVGLASQATVTDGDWHRVGFTWDRASRRLHVDDVLVAEDTQDKLADSYGKLILGAGKNMAPGSFWTGLVDDVRIYSRVVKP
jgi:hypothetical protein